MNEINLHEGWQGATLFAISFHSLAWLRRGLVYDGFWFGQGLIMTRVKGRWFEKKKSHWVAVLGNPMALTLKEKRV